MFEEKKVPTVTTCHLSPFHERGGLASGETELS